MAEREEEEGPEREDTMGQGVAWRLTVRDLKETDSQAMITSSPSKGTGSADTRLRRVISADRAAR